MKISKFLLVGTGLVLLGGGCFAANDVSVDRNFDGTATYTIEETGTEISVGAKIPANFPSEVPVYENGEVQSAAVTSAEGQAGASLMIITDDSVPTVNAWYESKLTTNGWTNSASNNTGALNYTVYENNSNTITVSVTSSQDPSQTTIVVIWAPKDN